MNAKTILGRRGILWRNVYVCRESHACVFATCSSVEEGFAEELVDLCGSRSFFPTVSTNSGNYPLRRQGGAEGVEVTGFLKHGAREAYAVGEHLVQLFGCGLHAFSMPNNVYPDLD